MTEPFLTPSTRALLEQVNANPAPPDYSPEAQRAGLNGAMAALGWSGDGSEPERIELPSGAAVYLFRPAKRGDAAASLVLYVHGGSFMAGGLQSHGGLAAVLAERTDAVVALIDYRLAPEARAPAALDDCVEAVRLLHAQSAELKIDAKRFIILGDSAGGTLAAATALVLRSEPVGAARMLVLINRMTTPQADGDASMRDFAEGFFAGAADFKAGWNAYQQEGDNGHYFDLASVNDLSGLPSTVVITNEIDPVRDQGEAFAIKASEAGVPLLLLRTRGLVHASWLFPNALPEAELLLATICGLLKQALCQNSDIEC